MCAVKVYPCMVTPAFLSLNEHAARQYRGAALVLHRLGMRSRSTFVFPGSICLLSDRLVSGWL